MKKVVLKVGTDVYTYGSFTTSNRIDGTIGSKLL